MIREQTLSILNGYIRSDSLTSESMGTYISESLWGSNAGIIGAGYLAQLAAEEHVESES